MTKTLTQAVSDLLDSEEIFVSSEIGDYLLAAIDADAGANIRLDARQRAAVLAGLRLVQADLSRGEYLSHGVHGVYDSDGGIEGLTQEELDELCETINFAQPPKPKKD